MYSSVYILSTKAWKFEKKLDNTNATNKFLQLLTIATINAAFTLAQQVASNKLRGRATCCGQQATCCAQQVACCPQHVACCPQKLRVARNLLIQATCCAQHATCCAQQAT